MVSNTFFLKESPYRLYKMIFTVALFVIAKTETLYKQLNIKEC